MTDIWTPSDDLLAQDPIAMAKVENPYYAHPDVVTPDEDSDEVNEIAAALALAESAGDDESEDLELELEADTDDEIESVGLPGDSIAGV